MKITFDISDDKATEVIEALCVAYGYQSMVGEDGRTPNPQTKAQFAKEQVLRFMKEHYKAYLVNKAKKASVKSLNTDVSII